MTETLALIKQLHLKKLYIQDKNNNSIISKESGETN